MLSAYNVTVNVIRQQFSEDYIIIVRITCNIPSCDIIKVFVRFSYSIPSSLSLVIATGLKSKSDSYSYRL